MTTSSSQSSPPLRPRPDIFTPIRRWLDQIEIRSPRLAHLICRLIPCTCPFEHHFSLFGYGFHTPPLCEPNPFYTEFVSLRFRALSYLADVCGEDVAKYIC